MTEIPPDAMTDEERADEQAQLAREIGEELTDAFAAYVRGDVTFEDLTFGVFDALSDLHIIAGGNYALAEDDEHEHEHEHDDANDEAEFEEQDEDERTSQR